VLKGWVIDRRRATLRSLHYQIQVFDGEHHHRVAVNAQSAAGSPEVLYFMDEAFEHAIVEEMERLPPGLTRISDPASALALDYVRDGLVRFGEMSPIPYELPDADNDLNDRLDRIVLPAMADPSARIHAFGEPWGPERKRDAYFGFQPGRGIHNIHMNQGNRGRFAGENGVQQDGALFVELPGAGRWVAVFLAFQSQSWSTSEDGEPL
jgi:uncharacterized protein YukJ